MSAVPDQSSKRPTRVRGGYVLVMFVVIVAFVAVAAAMQVLILTSVATTSRAYDTYRQGAAELLRLEQAVNETLLEQRQVSVAPPARSLGDSVAAHLDELSAGGAVVRTTRIPAGLPTITSFPDMVASPDALGTPPPDLAAFLTPELAWLSGPRVVAYPEVQFEFSSERPVLGARRTYCAEVRARILAVPLSRFPVFAYDLPSEIGAVSSGTAATAGSALQGLVPSRDPAFVADMQPKAGVLPYHYRRCAVLSAAYQYVFSQRFIDRLVEYAGPTHFRNLDSGSETAVLGGMSTTGSVSTWDLADAGTGTYQASTGTRNAVVVYTETAGQTLRLHDTSVAPDRSALFVLVVGPANMAAGPLVLELASIARPLVIVAYHVRVSAAAGARLNGALLLDPTSSFTPGTSLALGHLSYWAGTSEMSQVAVTAEPMPEAAEVLTPRVVYVATRAGTL